MPYFIQRDALNLYAARVGVSEREHARRAFPDPDMNIAAAQMRLRRRKARPRVEVSEADARAIAGAVGVAPAWLDSPLCSWLVNDRGPVPVGAAVYLFDHAEEAGFAARLLERSGFAPRPAVFTGTLREAEDWATYIGRPPLFNAEDVADSSLDAFEILLDIERRLRGHEPQMGEVWLAPGAWIGWTKHLPRAAVAIGVHFRRVEEPEAAVLFARIEQIVALLHELTDNLRPDEYSRAPRPRESLS